ncbi:MAG: alpha/beta fold hydrolase [Terracidiphilus sp.]
MNGTFESGGARLAFRDAGAGTPVVFLHPTPLDGGYWRPLIEDLAGVRSIVPDLRGHGASELGAGLPTGAFTRVPDAPVLTMERYAADILALLDHLQLPSAFFAGCSIGGYVLLELWRRAPQRIRGLAFVCSKPQPDAEANLVKRAATIAAARERRPEIAAQVRARMTLSVEALVAVQAGLAVRPDSAPTVATIGVPVLAIAGGQDPAVAPAEMEAFRAAPGGCEFHLLPDAGHFAACEQPQKVAALISNWLRRHEI